MSPHTLNKENIDSQSPPSPSGEPRNPPTYAETCVIRPFGIKMILVRPLQNIYINKKPTMDRLLLHVVRAYGWWLTAATSPTVPFYRSIRGCCTYMEVPFLLGSMRRLPSPSLSLLQDLELGSWVGCALVCHWFVFGYSFFVLLGSMDVSYGCIVEGLCTWISRYWRVMRRKTFPVLLWSKWWLGTE